MSKQVISTSEKNLVKSVLSKYSLGKAKYSESDRKTGRIVSHVFAAFKVDNTPEAADNIQLALAELAESSTQSWTCFMSRDGNTTGIKAMIPLA